MHGVKYEGLGSGARAARHEAAGLTGMTYGGETS